jgi:hypothetical protein
MLQRYLRRKQKSYIRRQHRYSSCRYVTKTVWCYRDIYAENRNPIFEGNIDTIKKNTETLIDASKEVGLEINVEETKYMLLSRHQNVGQNRDIKIAKKSFENVSQFKYLGTTVTNQNLIQEEIRGDWILVRLATIRSRPFCLLVCCQKT